MESTDEQQCRIWLDTAFFGADCFQKGPVMQESKQEVQKKNLSVLLVKWWREICHVHVLKGKSEEFDWLNHKNLLVDSQVISVIVSNQPGNFDWFPFLCSLRGIRTSPKLAAHLK